MSIPTHTLPCGCTVGYEEREDGYRVRFTHCGKHGASERKRRPVVTYPVTHLLAAEVIRLSRGAL